MPITKDEWNQIYEAIEAARGGPEITFARVTRTDMGQMLVYCEDEFGDQPIAMAGQLFKIVYYDESPKGTVGFAMNTPPGNPYATNKKNAESEYTYADWAAQRYIMPALPPVGSTAIILLQHGQRRDPYCIGIAVGYTRV